MNGLPARTDLRFDYPRDQTELRGPGYWLKWRNLAASRRTFRADNSNRWRYAFHRETLIDQSRMASFSSLLKPQALSHPRPDGSLFRFIIIADTGEGDRSQYALLPAINALEPDFMIINGDVAYPAGRMEDYLYGFFEPYRGLDIPIWAVPGNHEYYSPGNGQEFFEIFCTRKHEDLWQSNGLRLVPQPATYWALTQRDVPAGAHGAWGALPLTVIGIDTGHSGNLDGWSRSTAGPLPIPWTGKRRFEEGDFEQHTWLDTRLREVDAQNGSAIVLFHIPSLVDTERKTEIHLDSLHQILLSHPCVRFVMCGHIHNYQRYDRATFRRFLSVEYRRSPNCNPDYVVAGAGGAGLAATDFKVGGYGASFIFPSAPQWRAYASRVRKALAGWDKLKYSVADHLAAVIAQKAPLDNDPVEFGCFLVVDVKTDKAIVTPFLMSDLAALYPTKPPGSVIALNDSQERLALGPLNSCLATDPGGQWVITF